MSTAKLYLIPAPLGDYNFSKILPPDIKTIIESIDFFIAENIRTARRYFSALKIDKAISDIVFYELNKRTDISKYEEFLAPLADGKSIGIVSEAGCPGVADPGADIVALAHKKNIDVVPLVGPSSILLAMMASGFNGQSFAFNGYLPIKGNRTDAIKKHEQLAQRLQQTQIYIETPYRNQQLFEEFIKHCSSRTRLCVACDLTLESEYIKTDTIAGWKKRNINLHKRQVIFLLQ